MGSAKVEKQENKLVHIMKMPIRALSKARDLYVKSMKGYAEKFSYSHSMGSIPAGDLHFPRSFSASSSVRSSSSKREESEDFMELVRAASARSFGHKNEADMYLQELIKKQQQQRKMVQDQEESLSKTKGMGRIDEEAEEEGSFGGNVTPRRG